MVRLTLTQLGFILKAFYTVALGNVEIVRYTETQLITTLTWLFIDRENVNGCQPFESQFPATARSARK